MRTTTDAAMFIQLFDSHCHVHSHNFINCISFPSNLINKLGTMPKFTVLCISPHFFHKKKLDCYSAYLRPRIIPLNQKLQDIHISGQCSTLYLHLLTHVNLKSNFSLLCLLLHRYARFRCHFSQTLPIQIPSVMTNFSQMNLRG